MLFPCRIGFSGTPSDLLPVEMGKCVFQEGDDGRIIHTLCSPSVMTYSLVGADWSAKNLLEMIAKRRGEPFHALIDTGALITGMSNLEVGKAQRAFHVLVHAHEFCDTVE